MRAWKLLKLKASVITRPSIQVYKAILIPIEDGVHNIVGRIKLKRKKTLAMCEIIFYTCGLRNVDCKKIVNTYAHMERLLILLG